VIERLTIDFTPAEGAMVRMLGLIERRGYLLRNVAMNEDGGTASLVIDVQPLDSSRRVEVVAQQLGRLIDVNKVSHSTPATGSPQ
jgi:acetolactate synthase regulatory subunit